MTDRNPLQTLQAENARLIALLDSHGIEWQLPSRVALFGGMLKTIDAATAGNADAEVLYASTVASLKNGLKRAQGELEGLQRSDAVRVRRDDEQALLAWLGKGADASLGATLYVDALSAPGGPAGSYLALMRYNVNQLALGMQQN